MSRSLTAAAASLLLAAACMAEHPPVKAVLLDIGQTLVTGKRGWAPGALEALEILREAEVPVGLLSNTGDLTRGQLRLRHLPVDFRFSDFPVRLVNLSSELGVAKPDPEVYRKAARRAGLSPGEIVFLDEGIEQVLGAQRAGMLALQVHLEVDEQRVVTDSDLPELARQLAELFKTRARSPKSSAMNSTVSMAAPRR